MSTIAYGLMTARAKDQGRQPSDQTKPSSTVSTYVSTAAALVPGEVLVLHATILSITTAKTSSGATGISDAVTLFWSFWGLIVLSIVLYILPKTKTWDNKDYLRMLIPPLAFVGWTMLQKTTAFDAIFPSLSEAPRTVIALFLIVALGLFASYFSYKAPVQKPENATTVSQTP
jgi:hypothetical protein